MREARLWKSLKEDRVQCRLCSHFCQFGPGELGKCGVRRNEGGALYTLVYDKVAAANVDPVEKKPLYHFLPGTQTFSIATMGCNLRCVFCQNASLSQTPRSGGAIEGRAIAPERIVADAKATGCESISYTYSEPTVFFELLFDTATLAKEQGLANIMVSNGFMSPQCLDALGPLIDAANIDLKAFRDEFYQERCGARLEPVKRNLIHIRKLGWHLEVTTLIIPGLNDSPQELAELAAFLHDELGPDTPWHVSRFHPTYKLMDRGSTPAATLERAWDIGREKGLRYVYVGNIPGHNGDNTYCPACGRMTIKRRGFFIERADPGVCAACGAPIPGKGMDRLARLG